MKTRRDFLAALGLGAGASVFGLPGVASACGRWRRRTCVEPVPCEAPVVPHQAGRILESTVTGCDYACPIYCYKVVNGVYYYRCYCCPQGGYCDTASQVLLPLTSGCAPTGGCIPASGITYKRLISDCSCGKPLAAAAPALPKQAKFFLSSTATDAHGNLHAKPFRDGMGGTDVTGDQVLAALKKPPKPDFKPAPISVDVSCTGCVTLSDPMTPDKKPIVALYTLVMTYEDPNSGDQVVNKNFPLCIGIEVTLAPTGYPPGKDPITPITPLNSLPHYKTVMVSNVTYHCITRA